MIFTEPKILLFIVLFAAACYAQNGVVITKYSNGNIAAELSFVNDVYDGTSYWYYENGYVSSEKTFSGGKLNGWIREYYPTGIIKEEKYISDGKLDGQLKLYYENGGLKKVMKYINGILERVTEVPFDENYQAPIAAERSGIRKKRNSEDTDEILCNVDICPEPLGGKKILYDNLIYPDAARLYGLQGEVMLLATIDEAGRVRNTQIIKGLELGCSEAAAEAVKKTRFTPGIENNKPVVSDATIRIIFQLDKPAERETIVSDEIIDVKGEPQLEESNTQNVFVNFTCEIDVCPKPIGGLTAIVDNLHIAPSAERLDIKGTIDLIVNVDEFGFVTDVEIEKGLGKDADSAVIETILNTRFEPGLQNNKYAAARVKIRVPFRLATQ